MNFFKKALLATAIAGSFGAVQAADLTDAVKASSVQGLEVGAAANTSLRVIVREQLEAGDVITLVFGKGVNVALTTFTFGGVSTGTGNLGIVYGSGTYTMGTGVATTTAGITTVTFEVLTGDPVTKDSSFEVSVSGVDIDTSNAAAATVTYSAKSGLTGNAKDVTGDNVGALIRTADQYGSKVKTELNGIIERATQKTFISGGIAGAATPVLDTDTLVLSITDDQALLSAASGVLVAATVTITGDFTTAGTTQVVASTAGNTLSAITLAGDKKSLSFTITDVAGGIAGDYTLTLDNTTKVIKAQDFTATISVDASTAVTTNTKQVTSDKADAGTWKIDATIINVPYFPVGFEGTDSSVHFSNLGPKADVIVEAVSVIDAAGKSVTYAAKDIGFDLAANSVTKVSQGMITTALGIPAGSHKLSVTFNIDGKSSDVSAYAYTQSAAGRAEISNSQQK